MPYIEPERIIEAKKMDLLTYLKTYEPHELVHFSGNTFTTRTHDSLKISNGKWMWWSRGFGGSTALDYLIKVKGYSFLEAVEALAGRDVFDTGKPVRTTISSEKRAEKSMDKPLLLPRKSPSNQVVTQYLRSRGIEGEIVSECINKGMIFESMPYHNAVFVGFNDEGKPGYGAYRSTNTQRIMGDCTGSKKAYAFRLVHGHAKEVHLFESVIDLLSYATLLKQAGQDWRRFHLLSLAGVYTVAKTDREAKVPLALQHYLKGNPQTRQIYLHLDNDLAGRQASQMLQKRLGQTYEVIDNPPPAGKDVNDFLLLQKGLNRKETAPDHEGEKKANQKENPWKKERSFER